MSAPGLLLWIGAIGWCVAVLVSLAGWGALLLAIFRVRNSLRSVENFAAAASVGLIVAVFVGGLLNLAHTITASVLIAMVVIGVALAAGFALFSRAPEPGDANPIPRSRASVLMCALLVLVLAVRVTASVHSVWYQANDDYQAYIAFPVKMMQTHHLAPDPFSERRIESQVGSGYFLQGLILAARPLDNIQMFDQALGLLLLALMSFALARALGLAGWRALLVPLLAVFTPVIAYNLALVYLPYALFLAMAYWGIRGAPRSDGLNIPPWLAAALLGGIAAVIAGAKSTYLPAAVLACVFIAVAWSRHAGITSAVRAICAAALGFLVVLGPWMAAQRAASGTFFYPVLGHGFDYTAYGLLPAPSTFSSAHVIAKIVAVSLPLLILYMCIARWAVRDAATRVILALTAAAFLSTIIVGWGVGGDSIRRYDYPFIAAVLILFAAEWMREVISPADHSARVATALRWMSVAIVLIFALSVWGNHDSHTTKRLAADLPFAFRAAPLASTEIRQQYDALNRALPSDGATLATVRDSFLLDFRGREIFIADYPGAAGPPPGWPILSDGDALGDYLRSVGVRYLVYGYADCAGLPDARMRREMADPKVSGWVRTQRLIVAAAHQQYAQLARSHKKIYDDGSIWVLDLESPAPSSQQFSDVTCHSPVGWPAPNQSLTMNVSQ